MKSDIRNARDPRIIVALDFPSRAPVDALIERLDPTLCRVKVGKELFTRYGPAIVETLTRRGFSVFLDLKFHDIPNTVAGACRAAADLGVWMLNVHALGGQPMMDAARRALDDMRDPPLLIAVTILTSMDATALHGVGLKGEPMDNVRSLAALAEAAGMDGVVCSPQESAILRRECGKDFYLVTPGVRPTGSAASDQARVMTPGEAISAGSDYLVIGRPITQADDPVGKLLTIKSEIDAMSRGA